MTSKASSNLAVTPEIALYAPVPLQHLASAWDMSAHGEKDVAFGSDNWAVFDELQSLSSDKAVDVYIQATHLDEKLGIFSPFWRGQYVGFAMSLTESFAAWEELRPESTKSDTPFKLYWRVAQLRPVEGWGSPMVAWETGKPYKKGFIPLGPLLVRN